jgi:phosphate/sulfate permease
LKTGSEFKDENLAFNKEKVKEIVAFWLMTVPVAFTFSYLITKLLLLL